MNYDPNDPLGDILSDDSDDSFFNDDKYKSSNKTKSHQIINIETKKTNLFGLGDESLTTKTAEPPIPTGDLNKSKDDWLGLVDNAPKIDTKDLNPIEIPKKKDVKIISNVIKETRTSDKLDFLDDFGLSDSLDKRSSEGALKEKFSLDDLLGKKPQTPKKPKETIATTNLKKDVAQSSMSGYTPTASTKAEKKTEFEKPGNSFKLKTQLKENEKLTPSGDINKRQKSNKDWLGLFGDESEDLLNENKKGADQKFSDLLNLPAKQERVLPKTEKTPKIDTTEVTIKKNYEIDQNKKEQQSTFSSSNLNEFKQLPTDLANLVDKTMPAIDIGSNAFQNLSESIDIEQQSATLCLKQQESHLMVALQLKAQEERLAAMQERQEETKRIQQEVVQGHREQLDQMLQGQMDHREQLQQIIMQHQHRINNHIQTLLQPTQFTSSRIKSKPEDTHQFDNNTENNIKKKEQYSEKDQLEQIISILKDNHEKELNLMETSYKLQLNLINETLSQLEERFKEENHKLGQFYQMKISKLEEENFKLYEQYELKIKLINERNETQISEMVDKHARDIETLQKQHHLIIDNIKNSITQEHTTIIETKDYSQKLTAVLTEIDKNNKMCMTLMQSVENITSTEINSQNKNLQRKEEQINRLLDNIENQRSLLETEAQEKKSSFAIIEEQLKYQLRMIEEEKNVLQKKQSDLSFERETMKLEYDNMYKQFELEKKIFKRNIDNAEKSNEEIKEDIHEKVKKMELDSQKISNEKQKINEVKNECQALKKKLEDEINELEEKKLNSKLDQERLNENEVKILERSRELEILTISALAKRKHAEEKMIEANYVKQKFQEKLNKIQEHSLSLNMREREIAKDKISLSRERLSLYNQRTESDYAICQLCKNSWLSQKSIKNHLEDDPKILHNNLALSINDNLFEMTITKDQLNDNMMNNFMNGTQNINREDLKLNKDEYLDKNIILGQVNNYGSDFEVLKLMKINDYETEFNENISQIFQAKYS